MAVLNSRLGKRSWYAKASRSRVAEQVYGRWKVFDGRIKEAGGIPYLLPT